MQNTIFVGLSGSIVAAALILPLWSVRAQQKSPPFTLTQVTHFYSPAGVETTTETTIFGQRSDGSWFRDFTREISASKGSNKTVHFRKFADFTNGVRVSFYPALHGGTSGGNILNHPVRYEVKTLKLTDRTVKREVWSAPDPGCAALRESTVVTLTNGQSGGTSQMEVSAIHLGDPSPAYFVTPKGWKKLRLRR